MERGSVSPEEMRNARPDVIASAEQLRAGQVVVSFQVRRDHEGVINYNTSRVALITGKAARIIDDEIHMSAIGPYITVEPLPTHTLPDNFDDDDRPDFITVGSMGIVGLPEDISPRWVDEGLLAVHEEPYEGVTDLEVGPGLHVIGDNDYFMTYKSGFMAVALDSDPRLRRYDP